jgi:hypothetical protein
VGGVYLFTGGRKEGRKEKKAKEGRDVGRKRKLRKEGM